MCRWCTYICLCLWIYRLYHLCLSCRCAVYILIRVAAAPQMVWYRSHLEQEEHHYQTRPTDTATLAPGCSRDGFKHGKMSNVGKVWTSWPITFTEVIVSFDQFYDPPKPIRIRMNWECPVYWLWDSAVEVSTCLRKTEEDKWINTSLSNLFTTVCNTASRCVEINVLSRENNTLRQVTWALMSRMI